MTLSKSADVTIVGAGIVGLATARALKLKYPKIKLSIIEKEVAVAKHQTGNNSGVIHAGLYYTPGSAKAIMAVRGRKLLIDYARKYGVTHELCGKVVVATSPSEVERLETLWSRGQSNGLTGLARLNQRELLAREPHVSGLEAILVPEEGIIDFKQVCAALKQELVDWGVDLKFETRVRRIDEAKHGLSLDTNHGTLESRFLIACGGLQADRILKSHGILSPIQIVPFRGEYYDLKPEAENLVRHLIYPVPDPAFPFLGVHFTRMATGGVECGPNAVLSLAREGYSKWAFSAKDALETLSFPGFWRLSAKHWRQGLIEQYRSFSKPAFVRALQKLIPSIRSEHLKAGGCGVRAQAMDPSGKLVEDFSFFRNDRCLFVLNAPSPAATASLAIGEEIVGHFESRL